MDRETGDGIKRHFDEVAEGLRVEMLAEMRALSEGLRAQMGGLADGLRAEMGGLTDGLRAEMGDLANGLRAEMGDLADGLRAEMGGLADGLRAEIRDGKRHSDVVAESLRGEIRLVAEGVAGLDQKFTMEFVKVREEIGDVKSLLQVSCGDLGRRVQALEGKPSSA